MRICSIIPGSFLSILLLSTHVMAKDIHRELPFGAIKPKGWIEGQIQKDVENGFVGKLDKLVPGLIYKDDIYGSHRLTNLVKAKDVGTHNSGADWEVQFLWWNSETQSNWWDGFLRNVLLLENAELKPKITEYIEAKLATADEDGYIGIYGEDLRYQHTTENGELWAQASLFRGLLAYYESTKEKKVLDAVIKAVEVTMVAYPINESTPFKTEGALAGVGHGLTFVDVLNSLYRLTADKRYLDYSVFLFNDYSAHPQPEQDIQIHNLLNDDYRFEGHGVHTFEHLRALTIAAFHSDDEVYSRALAAYLERLEEVVTSSGGPIGDEWIAKRHAHHSKTGYEYCSLQELLHSYMVLLQKTGDAKWADKIEWLLFNAAQGARHPNGKSVAYCQTDNSFDVLGHLDMNDPQGEMRFKYSPAHQDVAVCCAPNAGRIYPYFIQGMWHKTETGLVANLFGPSQITTFLADAQVKITQLTNYPFEHQVRFVVQVTEPVEFELAIRKPAWANKVELNGQDFKENNGYFYVQKKWRGEQEILLKLYDEPEVTAQPNSTAAVEFGPLLYALPLAHEASFGRQYPLVGFRDQFFTSIEDSKEGYRVMKNSEFLPVPFEPNMDWQTPHKLTGKLFDPATKQLKNVELLPMGSTILRKVNFEMHSD